MKLNVNQIKNQETVITLTGLNLSSYPVLQLKVFYMTASGLVLKHQGTLINSVTWSTGLVTVPDLGLDTGVYVYALTDGLGNEVASGSLRVLLQSLPVPPILGSETPSTENTCGKSGNIWDGLPGVGMPDFMPPIYIGSNHILTPENGYKLLIATNTTTIRLPEFTQGFVYGWYCFVSKRTTGIVRFSPDNVNSTSIYSVDNSREILEVNGMACIIYTAMNTWQITGGLA